MSTFSARERYLTASILIGIVCAMHTSTIGAREGASWPDLASHQTGWVGMGGDFLPIPGDPGPKPMTYDPKYPYVPNNSGIGTQPTFRIADLNHPNLKPWAKERMKKDNEEVLAGKFAFTPRSSCMPAGVPGFMAFGGQQPYYFIQTPKQVFIIYSGDQQVRRIYLDVPHTVSPKPSWYGESVGHYEGDTLVASTVGLNAKSFIDPYRTPHTEKLRVVERWRVIDGGERLEVRFTVDDPDTYYQPWSAMRRFRKGAQDYREEVCSENNDAFFDYKIPKATKVDF
jgi:hypothetical protein